MIPYRKRSFAALVLGVATMILAAALGAEPAGRFRILYHEPVDRPTLVRTDAAPQPWPQSRRATRLAFDALGRRFDLALEPNERLLQTLPSDLRERLSGLELYRGSLRGAADSWARVGILRGRLHGLIWDGSELFGVEPAADLRDALAAPPPREDDLLIFRLRDIRGSFHDEALPNPRSVPYQALVGELKEAAARAATQRLDIGVVADVEFQQLGDAEEEMLLRMNEVDGIFSEQVGVQINVALTTVFTSEPDPFSSAAAEVLLQSLGDYRFATQSQKSQGLTHLFTGRDLTGDTIGIAYLGTICDAQAGAGLTQATSGVFFDSLTAAHEIGHNFGAPHDAEPGSPCVGTPPTFLMAPAMNGSDQFSECSLDQMAPFIASASCLKAVVGGDVSVAVDAPASMLLGAIVPTTLTVENVDTTAVHDATVSYEATPGTEIQGTFPLDTLMETCSNTTDQLTCTVGSLFPGERKQVGVSLEAVALGTGELVASVSSGVDTNPANDTVSSELSVTPGAALLMQLSSFGLSTGPGGTLHLEATLHNETRSAATGVTVNLTSSPFQMFSVDSLDGTCTPDRDDLTGYECAIGTMQAGADAFVDIMLRAPDVIQPSSPERTNFEAIAGANEPLSRISESSASALLTAYHAATDLSSRVVSAPDRLDLSEPVHFTVALDNLGPDDVRSFILVYVGLSGGLALEPFTSSTPGCVPDVSRVICTVPELASGDTFEIEVDTVAPDSAQTLLGSISVRNDDIIDTDLANNDVTFGIDVANSDTHPASGGGGGGGGGAALDLLALALVGMRMGRRAQ